MYLVHFTKDAAPLGAAQHPGETLDITPQTAKDRLFTILRDTKIRATRMPWTNKRAVCFTECTWPSLLAHAEHYSPYGIGFRKEFIFATGGGPAFYMPPGLLEKQRAHVGSSIQPFDPELFAFFTPFAPSYAPKAYKDQYWNGKAPVDYSHEREWRVAHDLEFKYETVSFVIVDTYEDMAQAPRELKDALGRDRWLIMANYRKIEELWPIHLPV